MVEAFAWWLTLELLGLIALPVAAVLLRALPDRGYSASKILGLLLVGWLGYTLSMMQLIPFERWSLLLCALVLAAFSVWLLLRKGRALWEQIAAHYMTGRALRYILVAELLFTLAFALWALVRAYQPNIVDQEKFMDFGFLNSILKTGVFPPNDMWLAGYSINYYYFGYVLMAALTSLSGVRTEIAFNLANAALFALTALGGFGVIYNLITASLQRRAASARATAVEARVATADRRRREAVASSKPAATQEVPVRKSRAPAQAAPAEQSAPAARGAVATAARPVETTTLETAVAGNGHSHDEGDGFEGESVAPPYYPVDESIETARRRVPWFLSPYLYAILGASMLVAMGNLTTTFTIKDRSTPHLDSSDPIFAEGDGFRFCFMCVTNPTGYDWFAPSRVIQDFRTVNGEKQKVGFETINEFPAFSFLLADLHPHVMALPLVLLAIAIAQAFARRRVLRGVHWREFVSWRLYDWFLAGAAALAVVIAGVLVLLHVLSFGQVALIVGLTLVVALAFHVGMARDLHSGVAMLVAAIVIGSLYTVNTWDYPTYLLLVLAALFIPYLSAYRAERAGFWSAAGAWLLQAAGLVALSLAVFLPFQLTFKSLVGGQPVQLPDNWANMPVIGWVLQKLGTLLLVNTADKTILGFVVIFGIFLSALLVWLAFELARFLVVRARTAEDPRAEVATWVSWGIFFGLTFFAAFLFKFPLLALLLPVGVVAVYLAWQEPRRVERNVALVMLAIGAFIGLGVEVVYLRDNFQMRMNTLFKFYYQIWVLWALAAAFGLWLTLDAAFRRRAQQQARARVVEIEPQSPLKLLAKGLSGVWAVVVLLLVLSGLMYTYYGVMSRQVTAQPVLHGLDGTAWLSDAAPGDYQAINWLKANGTGKDRVLEAGSAEYYRPGRVSSYTGVPTLVAWDNSHEALWRTNQPDAEAQITERRRVVNGIYQGKDPDSGAALTQDRLLQLLHQYQVDYVFVGATEHGDFGGITAPADQTITDYAQNLFKATLPEAFRSTAGDTVIYGVKAQPAGTGGAPPTPLAGSTPGSSSQQPNPNVPPAGLFDLSSGANRGQLSLPRGITQDAQGNIYVVDTGNMRVQKFDKSGKWLALFGVKGSGNGQFAPMNDQALGTGPGGIAVDKAGNIYVADTWNHRVQKFDSSGKFLLAWGSFVNLGDPASAQAGPDKGFYGPRGVAVGPDGNVYVTDTGNKRVMIFDPNGNFARKIDSGMGPNKVAPQYPFNAPGELNEPVGIAVASDGSVYVADTNNARIQKFDASGKFVTQWAVPAGSWAPGPYLEPFVALDAAGNVYATAPTGGNVLKFSPTGQLLGQKNRSAATILKTPTGITLTADGKVFVVDTSASGVLNIGTIP